MSPHHYAMPGIKISCLVTAVRIFPTARRAHAQRHLSGAMVCIAVADDHAVVREGLKRIISEQPDLSVSIAVGTGEELLTAMRQSPADLAIIDLVLGSRSGLDVLRRIRAEHPQL